MRINYWSCSKFAKWCWILVGVKPMGSGSSEHFHTWDTEQQKNHPFLFWFTEEFLDSAQDVYMWIPDQIDKVRAYYVNRFVDKIHYLPTGLKPGIYSDASERLLRGMFETLVDFVEVEKASMQRSCGDETKKSPFLTNWRRCRDPELGIKYLQWEMSLTDDENGGIHTHQAEKAREILELYLWWKNIYPNRPDPYDTPELNTYYKETGRINFGLDREQYMEIYGHTLALEEAYRAEDEAMSIRLVKIREQLWT